GLSGATPQVVAPVGSAASNSFSTLAVPAGASYLVFFYQGQSGMGNATWFYRRLPHTTGTGLDANPVAPPRATGAGLHASADANGYVWLAYDSTFNGTVSVTAFRMNPANAVMDSQGTFVESSTTTFSSYVQPASGVAVTISVVTTAWMTVGQS